jgi:hypothetical protein
VAGSSQIFLRENSKSLRMKNFLIQRVRRSTSLIILTSMLIAVAISVKSLDDYSYAMVSEEAGIAFRGFPYPMLISKSVFYGGYVGQAAKEGGSEYIREAAGGDDNYRLFVPGLVANTIIYGVITSLIVALDINRHYLIGWATDTLRDNGSLLGSVQITVIVIASSIFLLAVLFTAFYFFAAVMSTFFP